MTLLIDLGYVPRDFMDIANKYNMKFNEDLFDQVIAL